MSNKKLKRKKLLIKSLKIAIGSVVAILIATSLHLEFATSAGIITLLSILSTKWDTLKLSGARILSFFAVVLVVFVTEQFIGSEWIAYGIFIFLTVFLSGLFGIESTISVNAVVGTHFLTKQDFSFAFILNELMLILIGAFVAIILNLINGNGSQKTKLRRDMKYVEEQLRCVLNELADYLRHGEMGENVWQRIYDLEKHLAFSVECAYEYRGNTFASHPEYYISYMEMRVNQCTILYNLHEELNKIRELPVQAEIVANFMSYLRYYVYEHHVPEKQLQELYRLLEVMREEPLSVTRKEFEGRAILYHVLLDLESLLLTNKRFVEGLSKQQREIYWKHK